jgi:plastocyanin
MRRTVGVLSVVALTLAACGGGAVGGTIEVTGVDYGYSGVPELVESGAELTFVNDSSGEVHEIVLMKIADGEERSIQELLELPEEESESLAEFQGVLVALPGENGANPEGEGDSITVTEAGRYALICFIPQGADPAVVEEAMAGGGEGPPDMGDGTPHAFLGMVAEFEVTG